MKRSQKIHLVLVTAILASCNRTTIPSRSTIDPLTDSTFAGAAAGDPLTAGPEFQPVDDNYPDGYGPDTPPWYFPFNFNFYGVYYPYGWAPTHRLYNPGVVRAGEGPLPKHDHTQERFFRGARRFWKERKFGSVVIQ